MSFTTAADPERVPFARNPLLKAYLGVFLLFWLYTFIGTTDRAN